MALSEIINTSFLLSLAIILLVTAIIIFYMNFRLSQQDHKISSMLGLISTMAQEIEFFRNKGQVQSSGQGVTQFGGYYTYPNMNNSLIEVSDDEDDESEDEEDDDDDTSEESNNDQESEHEDNIKKLNINLGENLNEIIDIGGQINLHNDKNEQNEIESLDDEDDTDDLTIESEKTKFIKLSSNEDNLKLFSLDGSINDDFKTLHISGLNDEEQNNEISYKNMSVQKLRSIVLEKGVSINTDVTKLKKNELLKMLDCL